MPDRVAGRFGEVGGGRHAVNMRVQPQRLHHRPTSLVAHPYSAGWPRISVSMA